MSGFNTKTPIMDWSSFMRRDFQKENGMGALADAFNVVADTADGYGETADKKLLSDLVNETDVSKIDNSAFYSKDNALKAKNIIETNKNLEYQEEQRNRANELNARNDAEYAINQFNKEAMGDAINMDKATFEAKYKNAGGLDWAMMYDVFNKKEDRQFQKEDREQKNRLTNLQIQNTQNSINNQIEERNYTKEQRDKKELDEQNLNNLVGKYNSWDEFKNSEDWNKPEYNYTVKKTFYDSFGKNQKETSLTDQIKMEQIKARQSDLLRANEEYKAKTGKDLNQTEISSFLYEGKYPDAISPDKKKEVSDKVDKELRDGIEGLNTFKTWMSSYDPSYVGLAQGVGGKLADWVGNQRTEEEAAFRSGRQGVVGPIGKAMYGANIANKEGERIDSMIGTFLDSNKDFVAKNKYAYKTALDKMESNLKILKDNGLDTSTYMEEYKKAKEFYDNYKLDENDEISKDNAPVKITSIGKAKKINLEDELKKLEQSKNKNTTNQNKILTPSEAEALGIRFP